MYYSGRVHSIIFEDASQAYYIVKMMLDDDTSLNLSTSKMITVRGSVPGIVMKVGVWFGFDGAWKDDKRYGRQLVIKKAPVFNDRWDPITVIHMLTAHGVASQTLQQLRIRVGEDHFISVLSRIDEMKDAGLDDFTATYVNQQWMYVQAYFKSLVFLADLGLPPGKIRQVWSFFGEDAVRILSTNPWALVQLEGISFGQADEIALRLKLDMTVPERTYGAILYSCFVNQGFGHIFSTPTQVVANVQNMIVEAQSKPILESLAFLHKKQELVIERDIRPGVSAVYSKHAWEMETISAEILATRKISASFGPGGQQPKDYMKALSAVGTKTEKLLNRKKTPRLDTVIETAVHEWGEYESLELSETQKIGVRNALSEPISILTGLPGTGKTTSLKAAVKILQEAGITFLLCAPTGIAAKNLSALTGARAYTIHRAFDARGSNNSKQATTYAGIVGTSSTKVGGFDKDGEWGYGELNNHPAEVVIVDEASMMDQHLLYRILTCTSPTCRLVFVGDAAQLPSVGPGNVLRDMIASKRFPTIHLSEIFRQKDASDIIFASHSIYRGEVPKCDSPSDFMLIEADSQNAILDIIKRLAEKMYASRANFQILSPRHRTTVGVTNLNKHLRELLNPPREGLQEIQVGSDTIREDDRIMIIKNDYKLGVYNGDVGKISKVNRKIKEVEIKIFGPSPLIIKVPFKDMAGLIRMAYACTVHKAQGLEYDIILMPIIDGFGQQLQRNLLYTAVTRAKKKVVLIGSKTALAKAVLNDKEDLRNTLLRDRVEQNIPE